MRVGGGGGGEAKEKVGGEAKEKVRERERHCERTRGGSVCNSGL